MEAANQHGASVWFGPTGGKIASPNGNFNIEKRGRVYVLNSIITFSSEKKARSLENWHRTFGHCNVRDILSLEKVVEGMEVTGKEEFQRGTCMEGKLTQYRSREPDARAIAPLQLVHCDLAGPIDPPAK